jgi:hypothetical protein
MNCYSSSTVRKSAFVVLAWLTLAHALRGQESSDHESPLLVPAQPSVYLRIPRVANAGVPPAALSEPSADRPVRLPAVQQPVPRPSDFAPIAPKAGNAAAVANELWLVSTRRMSAAGPGGAAPELTPDVFRYVSGRGWIPSSLDELVRARPLAVTSIFVHGNDTDAEEAVNDGTGLYGQLVAVAANVPPTRFIIWSWPIEKTGLRVRRSAQTNASRSNVEGYFLAAFLRRLGPDSPISILGYSSGAAVVTGALHVLGGGTLENRRLADPPQPHQATIDAVLLGAAMPNDWLLPGRPHDRALVPAERLVVTMNPEDAVLHWYPLLWGRGGPVALGSTGIANASALGPGQAKLAQFNLERALGRNHGWQYYSASPEVISLLRHEMLQLPATRNRPNAAVARQPR